MFEELLPIGSVVLLQGGTKKLMVIGIKPVSADKPNDVYDYIGVLYPEGFLSNEHNYLFNHVDINDVVFMGYNNPERKAFMKALSEAYLNNQSSDDNA